MTDELIEFSEPPWFVIQGTHLIIYPTGEHLNLIKYLTFIAIKRAAATGGAPWGRIRVSGVYIYIYAHCRHTAAVVFP